MPRQRRILITGATGQLGRALVAQAPPFAAIDAVAHNDLDIRDWHALRTRVAHFQPDVIFHAAAATDVDGCERDPGWAFAVNALGTRHVAQAAALVNAELVCVSTNYVFDGIQPDPYHEFDSPRPISVYGASKLSGEREACVATPRVFIVRTAWLYAAQGRNFPLTMRRLLAERSRLTVVADQFGNPTYATDLAAGIYQLVERGPYGTYHLVNQGSASWHAWASELARLLEIATPLDPIPGADYPRAATPPTNGVLASLALPALGITLPDWRDALRRCFAP